jgi:hypothetical protein
MKTVCVTLITTILLTTMVGAMDEAVTNDEALAVVPLNTKPGPEYQAAARLYQGVPGIARDDKSGRLWATWYSGGREESKENYVVVVTSADDGLTRTEPVLVVDPPHWYNRTHGAGIVRSLDDGRSFTWIGGAPGRNADWTGKSTGGGMEHMIVERNDGTLWMPMRIQDGLAETTSPDDGVTWSPPIRSAIEGPGSRFHLRRLRSGRLLMINHVGFSRDVPIYLQRSHLTAMLSDDEGKTWPHRLLLDDRTQVSYPDAIETPEGELRIIYDHGRSSAREILLAKTNEADILAGRPGPETKLRLLINKATGPRF